MNRAIARHFLDDFSIALAALLLILVVALNAGSTGYTRHGGDGDEGSGIGGTGRMGPLGGSGEGGGSGFGGTGLRPFLGVNELNGEVEIIVSPSGAAGTNSAFVDTLFEPSLAALLSQVPAPVVSAREVSLPSSAPVNIADELQYSLDSQALFYATAMVEPFKLDLETGLQPRTNDKSGSAPNDESNDANAQPSWGVLASYIGNEDSSEIEPAVLQTDSTDIQSMTDRNMHPDKIQRPDLPPIQRIRPVERISVLPPRIQPMRI